MNSCRFFLFWQKVRDADPEFLLYDLVSKLELLFQIVNDFVSLLDVELGTVLPPADVEFSQMELVLLFFLQSLKIRNTSVCDFR